MPALSTGIPAPDRAKLRSHLEAVKAKSQTWRSPLDYDPGVVAGEIIRLIKIGKPRAALRYYDQQVQNSGIEGLVKWNPRRIGEADKEWLYSNTGETYDATLILHPGGTVKIGCWGDIAERYSNLDTFTPRFKN